MMLTYQKLSLCLLLPALFTCTKVEQTPRLEQQPLKAAPAPWWGSLLPDPYIAKLSPEQRREYEYATNELLCPCGDHTEVFAACIEQRSCPEALLAASMMARLLKENVSRNTAEALVAESYGGAPAEISTQDAPILGDPNAPITLVDFADFQCPFCAKLAVELHKVVLARPQQVRLVYKYFPIPSHPYAYLAAEAAAFAQTKNKFWELHDLLFSRQKSMSREAIVEWATEVGLSATELETALSQSSYSDRVKRDEAEGDRLKVGGTPTLYLNGRIYNEAMTAEAINRAIDEALQAQQAVRR